MVRIMRVCECVYVALTGGITREYFAITLVNTNSKKETEKKEYNKYL